MNTCEARGGYEKWGGGAVRFRPYTKSGGLLSVLGPIRKAGVWGGGWLLSASGPIQVRYEKLAVR